MDCLSSFLLKPKPSGSPSELQLHPHQDLLPKNPLSLLIPFNATPLAEALNLGHLADCLAVWGLCSTEQAQDILGTFCHCMLHSKMVP